jgi:prepilin-type N-terminal cleavage/methylation domain-containing protein
MIPQGRAAASASLKRGTPAADTDRVLRREDGFTLVELIVVIVIITILVGIAVSTQLEARERAGDATAQMNLRIATPAIEAYRSDQGTYAGMTLAALQAAYSPGVQGIEVLSADGTGYCVRASASGSVWFKNGPDAPVTTTACS